MDEFHFRSNHVSSSGLYETILKGLQKRLEIVSGIADFPQTDPRIAKDK
jgi:hypothetical protein